MGHLCRRPLAVSGFAMSCGGILRQYSLEGMERPAFQQMVFLRDDMVNFADIGLVAAGMAAKRLVSLAGKVVQLPHSRANELRKLGKLRDSEACVGVDILWHNACRNSLQFHHISIGYHELINHL